MKKHLLSFLLTIGCLVVPLVSFSGRTDSLETVLKNTGDDLQRLHALQGLCEEYTASAEFDKAEKYGKQAMAIAVKIRQAGEMAHNYYLLGNVYYYRNDLKGSLPYYHKSLEIRELIFASDTSSAGSKKKIANACNDLGFVYDYLSNYPAALSYYLRCMKISEEIGDKELMAVSYINVGNIYDYQGDKDKALEYFHKSAKMNAEIGRKHGIAMSCNNMGNIYYFRKQFGPALLCQKKALAIKRELGNPMEIASSLNNLANIFVEGDKVPPDSIRHWLPELDGLTEIELRRTLLDSAGTLLNEALELCKAAKNEFGMMQVYKSLGMVSYKRGDLKNSLVYYSEAVKLGDKLGTQKELYESYGTMADICGRLGNFDKAYKFQKLFSELRDTVFNENKEKDFGKQEARFEYDKELLTRQKEQEKKDAIHEEEKRRQKLTILGTSAGLILVLVLALFILRSYRQKQKANAALAEKNEQINYQKSLVEEKNKDILDSIYYARRIQRSLLTTEKYIEKTLKRLKKNV